MTEVLDSIPLMTDNAKIVNIVPNNYNFHREKKLGTRTGYTAIQVNEYVPNKGSIRNPVAGSQVGFDIHPDSTQFDSAPELSHDVFVTITRDAGSGEDLTPANLRNYFGAHSFPLMRSLATATININGKLPITSVPEDIIEASQYNLAMEEIQRITVNGTPDNLFEYDAVAHANVLRAQADGLTWGRGVGNAEMVKFVGLGVDKAAVAAEAGMAATPSTANSVVVHFKYTERVVATPLQWFAKDPQPLVGITSITFNFNYGANLLNKMVAYLPHNADFAATAVHLANPRLKAVLSAPHVMVQPPRTIYWNAPRYDQKIISPPSAAVASGATVSLVSPTHPFSVIPKMYCIYAYTERDSPHIPERFYPIQRVQIDFGLGKNLMQNYDAHDLFKISRKNGYNGNAAQFLGGITQPGVSNNMIGTGCVLYLLPSDFATDNLQQSNVEYIHNFRVQAVVKNHSSDAVDNIRLAVIAVGDSVLINDNGVFTYENASIRPDMLTSENQVFADTNFDNHHILGGGMYSGGSFWNTLKKVWGVAANPITKQVVRYARNMPVVSGFVGDSTPVGSAVKSLGYGKRKASSRKKASGRGVIELGGASMNENRLMQLLNR